MWYQWLIWDYDENSDDNSNIVKNADDGYVYDKDEKDTYCEIVIFITIMTHFVIAYYQQ